MQTMARPTLIYTRTHDRPLSIVAVTPKPEDSVTPPFPEVPRPPLDNAFSSSAPLENVKHTQVFHHPETGHCLGVILEYLNGGRRALGQCRIGVDPFVQTQEPTSFTYSETSYCIQNTRREISRVFMAFFGREVSCSAPSPCCWERYAMGGIIQMWFTEDQSGVTLFAD